MGIYQTALIMLYAMSLTAHLVKHGQSREGKYNFWSSLVTFGIILFLLIQGGYFKS